MTTQTAELQPVQTASYRPTSIPVAGPLPNTYLLLEAKRSGFEPDDVIVQICHIPVIDGKPRLKDEWKVDWSYFPDQVSKAWLESRLARHLDHQLTYSDLEHDGNPPHDVLMTYRDLICDRYAGLPIVGHSVFKEDLLALRNHFITWLGDSSFDFLRMACWDIGLMQKAMDGGLTIWCGESIGEFHRRVIHNRLTVKWSLDHCLSLYGTRVQADRSDPFYRLWAAHEVYQAQRRMINGYVAVVN